MPISLTIQPESDSGITVDEEVASGCALRFDFVTWREYAYGVDPRYTLGRQQTDVFCADCEIWLRWARQLLLVLASRASRRAMG